MLRISLVGDIALLYGEKVKYSEALKDYFNEFDYRFCNFEGAVKCNKQKTISKFGPAIIQESNAVDIIKELNIDVACLANNHICDYGLETARKTIELLEKAGISHVGLDIEDSEATYVPIILEKKGISVAVFNAAEAGFGCSFDDEDGYAWLFSERLDKKIREYKDKCNHVVLIAHGGMENVGIPLPEWRKAYKHLIDAGVDAVIATHPHIIQPFEVYNGKPIFYSLGNFIYQEKGYDPISQVVSLEISSEKIDYSTKVTRYSREKGVVDFYDDKQLFETIKKNYDLLNSERYLSYIDDKCLEVYENYFEKYHAWGECVYWAPMKMRLLSALSILIRGHRTNDIVKYHNYVIETNYWIARRALRLIRRKKSE